MASRANKPPPPIPAMEEAETTAMATIQAMLLQEEHVYCCRDFILSPQIGAGFTFVNEESLELHRAYRCTMVGWAQDVTDFMHFQRETAEYAVSFFDRFLQTASSTKSTSISSANNGNNVARRTLKDLATFRLAFIACVYTAVKMHEPTTMTPTQFSKLSKGVYSPSQIVEMEAHIVFAIQWRLNPPTALSFVREYLAVLEPLPPQPSLLAPTGKSTMTLLDLARVQFELILGDYRFVTIKKSTLALAALMNGMDSLHHHNHAVVQDEDAVKLLLDPLLQEYLRHVQTVNANDDATAATIVIATQAEIAHARSLLYQVVAAKNCPLDNSSSKSVVDDSGVTSTTATTSASSISSSSSSHLDLEKEASRHRLTACRQPSPRSASNKLF